VGAYLARRLAATIPLLIAVSFLTHVLLAAAPGDYFTRLADNPAVTDQYLAALRSRFHLDGGTLQRYWAWLSHALTGDFGYSFRFDMPVFTLIGERMGNTLLLSGTSLMLAWGLALPLGSLAAAFQGTWIDRAVGVFSFVGLSIPRVFFALLMVLFAATTRWFPTGGMRDAVLWEEFSPWEQTLDVAHHLVLPALVIGLTQMAGYLRQMRAEMMEALGQDYVRTARAKGLHGFVVTMRHAFPNAVNPLVTLFGYSLASLLTGAFLVEVVFSWPGLATLTVDAVFAQDEPVVMASVVMATLMLVLGNLVADILLAFIDPRIALSGRK
jgi:peptide/nickel transport system permease protein